MYLSKLSLDRRVASVRGDLRNCQNMHRSVMRLFGESRRETGVLYRVRADDRQACVYVLSREAPSCPPARGMTLEASRDMTAFADALTEGKCLAFDLLCVPSKKVQQAGVKNSRRRLLRTEEERMDWLKRRAESGGFTLLAAREEGQQELWGLHEAEKGAQMRMTGVRFCGWLRITDARRFKETWQSGIGAGKAYGLGMMMLAGG